MNTKSKVLSFVIGIMMVLGLTIFTQSASAYVVYTRPVVVVHPAYVHPYYYGGWHRWHGGWGYHRWGWHRW